METLIQKISSYELFNNFLPGMIFYLFTKDILNTGSNFTDGIMESLFLCYFIGIVISRVGSIIIEPIFKCIGIIKYAPYKYFIKAEKEDPKLIQLSETNNMYRTLVSTVLCIYIFHISNKIFNHYESLNEFKFELLIICLLILFSNSYRKQTEYIRKRVEKYNKS